MSGSIIEIINKLGVYFCDHALRMLIQSSILIAGVFVIDLFLRKRIKAVFRYCIWLLVFVKLVTPATLSLPTGIGYWFGDLLPEKTVKQEIVKQPQAEYFTGTFPISQTLPQVRNSEPVINLSAANIPVLETPVITPAAPSIKEQSIIFMVWLVGEFILVALFLQRTFFVKRIIAQSKPAESKLQEILSDSCQKLGIRKKIELRISQSLLSPAACGLLRPRIILPSSLLKHFSSEKLRTTMLHELAHIKRKDIWINSLQTFLQIFYFYNPLLWFANTIVRRIREQAVDETVLVYLGEKADTYSSTLVDIAEIAFAKPSLGLNMIGVVESKKALTGRIKHILTRPFPKTVKLGVTGLAAIILAAFVLIPMAKAQRTNSQKTYTAGELVKKIIESENKIHDAQAHYGWYEQKDESFILLNNSDWGYDTGKEYIIEYNIKNNNEPNIPHIYTFNDNIETDRNYDSNRGTYSVAIQKDNFIWNSKLNPKMLLGYSLSREGHERLGTLLPKAEELIVSDQKEQINGHLCTVLEVIGLSYVSNQENEYWYDIKIWIDTERDFRPLKMESYDSYGENRPYAGNKRWSILKERIDNIELKKIDGVWFPVKGDRQVFSIKDYLPPEGMTRKEFQEAYANSGLSEKQIREKLTPVLEPMVEKRRINITDIKINKGIPTEKFTVELLDGYVVYDEFLGKSYTVGEPSEKEVLFSDDEILAQIKNLTPSELIERIPIERRGKDIRKWMAIIYRLAEIGSPAVPDITAALEKADTPNMQSTLAFALRAIGDPNAVPALIDAMERSIESSDYGLGDAADDSKLKTFYRRYQIKPESQSLGLGRAVRETTITLERLTGHTEGHDHFNYRASLITPEVIDEMNERKHQAAEKWRAWWQANKDTAKFPMSEPEQPVKPVQANSQPRQAIGGVLASPESSMVSFAIVPNIGDSSKQPNISIEQNRKYIKDVDEYGPYLGAMRGDSHQWEMIMHGLSKLDGLSTSTYQNRTYVLTCARAIYVMRPEGENKLLWSLEDASPAVDANGKPAIYIRFDEKGGELFAEFTKANIGNRMAISIDNYGIVSIPYIMSALSRELIITGDFTDDLISEIVGRLRKGMVNKPVPPALIQAAEKIKKDDIPNMSPREFIESLLTVGFAHNMEKLLWFVPDISETISVDDFAQIADGDMIDIVDVYSDTDNALVITSEIKIKDESDTDENGQLVFFLKKQEGRWQIDELDITNLRSAQWFIDHFLEKHPNAKPEKQLNILGITVPQGKYTAALPNGVTVELLGVCDHPSKDKKWWKPDGTKLDGEGFGNFDYGDVVIAKENQSLKLIAFRLDENILDDFKISYSLSNSRESRYAPNYINRARKKLSPIQVILAAFPNEYENTDIQLGVATGEWDGIAARTQGQATTHARDIIAQNDIIYDKAIEKDGITYITATHLVDKNYDCCIIAQDAEGNKYKPVKYSNSGSTMRQCKNEFDIPLEQIEWFGLSARPFKLVTYKNIYLQPKTKPEKQLVTSGITAPSGKYTAALPNGVTVELLGVCEHPSIGKQWWKPDGSKLDAGGLGDIKNEPYLVPNDSEFSRVFAINLGQEHLEDLKLSWKIESIQSSFYPRYQDEERKKLKTLQTIIAKFPKDIQREDLTIKIAVGSWESVANGVDGTTNAVTNDNITDSSVIFHEADIKGSNLKLSATHLLRDDYDCRMAVYDKNNNLHEPIKGTNTGSKMRLCEGYFDDITLDQIKYITLQARPFESVIFKNVSLHQDVNSNVQIKLDILGASSQTESQPVLKRVL
ncbi:MAG: hypothetical protein JW787_15995 [Sedimentisphaerales bacterium]|nr:hypothetical protein [Sedimentisphaerales bacterium]